MQSEKPSFPVSLLRRLHDPLLADPRVLDGVPLEGVGHMNHAVVRLVLPNRRVGELLLAIKVLKHARVPVACVRGR